MPMTPNTFAPPVPLIAIAAIAAIAAILAPLAAAAEWVPVGRRAEGQAHLDATSIRRLTTGEEFYSVRVRTVRDASGVLVQVSRAIVNCERLNDRVLDQEGFDAQGRLVERRQAEFTEAQAMISMRGERFEHSARVSPVCDLIQSRLRRGGVTHAGPGIEGQGAVLRQVPMVQGAGVYGVRARLNGAIDVVMVVDSGASTVLLPALVAQRLRQSGALDPSDEIGRRRFITADGRQVSATMVRLRSIELAGHAVTGVDAAILDVDGPVLLGQSFLSRLRHWSLNRSRQVFEFVP